MGKLPFDGQVLALVGRAGSRRSRERVRAWPRPAPARNSPEELGVGLGKDVGRKETRSTGVNLFSKHTLNACPNSVLSHPTKRFSRENVSPDDPLEHQVPHSTDPCQDFSIKS